MLIIDAQVHIWGSGKPSGHHPQVSVYSAEDLIKEIEEAGIDGAVLHPPNWDGKSNQMAIEVATRYPGKFCALGWFPLDDPSQRTKFEMGLPGKVKGHVLSSSPSFRTGPGS
jgi:predicted TIM-barrel fold metal-dependent hydrolase